MQSTKCQNSSLRIQSRNRVPRLQVLARSVPFSIQVNQKVAFGESIKAVGNAPAFGDWDAGKGAALQWQEGDVWTTTINIPVGKPLRFKLVKVGGPSAVWESGNDRELTALGPEYGLKMSCVWDKTEAAVESFKLEGGAPVGKDMASAEKGNTQEQRKVERSVGTAVMDRPSSKGGGGGSSWSGGSTGGTLSSFEEEARGSGVWVGAGPEFVKSKHDKGQRDRGWSTEGLSGVVLDVVQGDMKAANWLGKLGLVKSLLVDKAPMKRPSVEAMAASYIYTTWVNTGAIECAESGQHYRPNHHANLAMDMFRSLEWVIGDASQYYGPQRGSSPASSASVMAARRMHARLPSISGEFRQTVPLTRIRDIAHRGDIPHDVKQEIKHTLQNKLHRSAGPEDLINAEAMLKRLTAVPGQYSQPFVDEYKIFMKELREFFNASALEELLGKTHDSLEESHRSAVTQLLNAKAKVEASGRPSTEDLMALLFSATQARTFYVAGLSAGLRNDTSDEMLEMRQKWRLADVRLEEYCFVVLSRVINSLEEQGGAAPLSKAGNQMWALPLSALTAGLRNMGLSQFRTKELLLLENELQAWHNASPLVSSGRDNALRAKASIDRVLRLAAEYSDSLMKVFLVPAADLGRGLQVPSHMSTVFGESEVRSSVAFQVSKLAALMSKALRMAAGQSAWEGLVTGEAVGVLHEVPSLSPSAIDALVRQKGGSSGGFVLVVAAAEGDEELGPLVPLGLRGVVLRQELPHLSHLGVRARQEKVTFAMIDDRELYDQKVRPLLGRSVRLQVLPDGVSIREASSKEQEAAAAASGKQPSSKATQTSGSSRDKGASWTGAVKTSTPVLLALADTTDSTCGAKASVCADLDRLSVGSKGLFSTPRGCCLPFGTMDLAIAASGVVKEFEAVLADLERSDLTGDALDGVCGRMQGLIGKLGLPGQLLDQVRDVFKGQGLLAVRSSANVEDLAGMSAAGLYESVVGVPASDPEAVRTAVAEVWASLFTRRAVLSRRSAGVPQRAATMAVLIQELHCPKVSFVLHTARPSDANANVVLVEAAPGQGETLAAATSGTPWRFEVDKTTGGVDTLAFANFSRALLVAGSQGLVELEVDYSKQRITVDSEYRNQFAKRLAAAGVAIETYFGGVAQDIEGGLVMAAEGEAAESTAQLYIFQSRPQL